MNFNDFLTTVNDNFWNQQPLLRYGQTLMNTLHQVWPEKYNEIQSSDYDCFYDDTKVEKLIDYLKNNWITLRS